MSDVSNVSEYAMHLEQRIRELEADLKHLEAFDRAMLEDVYAERDRLAAIVERLPKTADGVPIVQGDTVYFWSFDDEGDAIACDEVDYVQCGDTVVLMEWDEERLSRCYSTREAAVAAASAEGGPS